MLVCLCSHSYSSFNNVLALIWFHFSYGLRTPCCSELCNLSAVILPVITFRRYPTLATSVQTRHSALVLRLIKFQRSERYPTPTPSVHTSCSDLVLLVIIFQRYPTQGCEIVCFHFWLDAIKLKTQTREITSIKCMWCLYLFRAASRIL